MSRTCKQRKKRRKLIFFFFYACYYRVRIGDSMEKNESLETNSYEYWYLKGLEEEKEKQEKMPVEEEVAELFGLSLEDIEQVILKNGKQYFKITIGNEIRMIENRNGGTLLEQFRGIQDELSYAKSKDERLNAQEIFNHQLKHQNKEATLNSVKDFIGNDGEIDFSRFGALKKEEKDAATVLLNLYTRLELEYINLENSFAVDRNGRVISVDYDPAKQQYLVSAAEIRTHEDQKVGVNSSGDVVYISDMEFDSALETILVPSDEATIEGEEELLIVDAKDITVQGVNINTTLLRQSYDYPEVIDRSELSAKEKFVLTGLAAAMSRKMQQRKKVKTEAKQYVLKKKDQQAAFIDSIFMSLLLGFGSGLLMAVITLAIRSSI